MKAQTKAKARPKTAGRADLALRLSNKGRLNLFAAKKVVDIVFREMEEALIKGSSVEIRGFGSFHVKLYKGYRGSHPKTGEPIQVKPKRRAVFKPSSLVKQRLNPSSAKKAARKAAKK